MRYHLDGASPGVTVDGPLFTQALRNLFDNAERHAATTISVHLVRDEEVTTLTVANDGPPIPSDRRDAIFEPFTRLDDARSLDSGGSGLGLAIARTALRCSAVISWPPTRPSAPGSWARSPPSSPRLARDACVDLKGTSGSFRSRPVAPSHPGGMRTTRRPF